MNGLARASVRFRPASFVGTFVALLFAAAVVTACGTLLQTGLTAHVPPARYAHVPVVVAADPQAHITTGHGDDRDTESEPLTDQPRLATALAARIAARPGVAAAVPDIAFPVGAAHLPQLTGRDWSAHLIAQPPGGHATGAPAAPRAGEVVLDAGTARAAHVAVGDTLTLTAPGRTGAYRVSGLVPAGSAAGPTAYFADAAAGALSGHPGRADAIAVFPAPGTGTDALADQARLAVGGHAKVRTGDGRGEAEQPRLAAAKETLVALGGSFGGIAAATAVFVVMGTVALAVGQRAREIALLRAVGATPRQIRRTVATEALLVAPLAGAAGIWPGIELARWWLRQLVHKGAVPHGVTAAVGWIPMAAAVGAGLLGSLLAGYLAARRPSKARPSEAMGEAAVERRRPGVVRTVLGVAAVAGGCVLAEVAAHATGDEAASVALGVVFSLMAGVAFLGPVVAWLASAVLGLPLRASGSVSGMLAAANTRAAARRLAAAITPIALVTAFCGTLLCMQGSITHTSSRQIREGVVADQVVGSDGAGLPASATGRAAALHGVDTAVGVLRTGALFRASGSLESANLIGVSGDAAALPQVLRLGVRSGSLAGLTHDGRTVAVDTLLAATAHVKVGGHLSLWLGDGTQVRSKVVAVYQRGLGLGQLLMPRDAVAAHAGTAYDAQVLVRDAPGADRSAVQRELAGLGVPGQTVTDRAGYRVQADKDLELNAWANRVMAAVLGGFAAVAAANTLVMTVLDRRREVALLRLAGTTRRQVRGMLRWEALVVAVSGLLIGGGIAWITLVPIARGLTGSAPYVPPATFFGIAGGALLLTLTATALPTRALLRAPVATAPPE
ncbi:putative ABC transport system permease protein [Actinacidiphila yanglinensis]|uniref:Putative ABC transport system permease protein n=1 Tax=Actinacidiphila yanglinensis TaxID=310779 RepID=A0A1H6DN38_9ACTN|nr:FtsX-like permease family protein [Actinacidiphila yanglinensis]SEG86581.1 putative ABC transport system permease protein [Actinacidiphila yanglinensis]